MRAAWRKREGVTPVLAGLEADGHPDAAVAPADEAAVVRAAQSDLVAFAPLYARYHARVYRYLLARANSAEEAADLTQQVFVQALDALPRYRDRGLPFAAWLFRIARNAATSAQRRTRPTVNWELVPERWRANTADDPEQAALRQERLERLRALLATLSADERELLALRFAGGLSAREIAPLVGKREAAVKRRLTRIIQRLREHYDDANSNS
jgi:RNA polymerase sigma-70 factor (ECF subfamily)